MKAVFYRSRLVGSLLLALLVYGVTGCAPTSRVRFQADDHYQLALSYRENRAYLLAEQEVRKALELMRNDPRYYELLAIIYQDQRRLQPAEEAYRLALQQPELPPSVLVNYSTLLLLRDRPDEAITLARRVLQDSRYDKPALAYTNIGVAYLKKDLLPQAAEQFRLALENQPGLPEAHYNLGLVYRKLGEHDKALRAFREAIRFWPSYVDAYAGLGDVLLELGRKEEARKAFERVIALEPDSDMAVASRQHLQRLPPERGAQHAGER